MRMNMNFAICFSECNTDHSYQETKSNVFPPFFPGGLQVELTERRSECMETHNYTKYNMKIVI